MATSVWSSFWSDDEIQGLSPNGKLAALWLLTNDAVTLAGITKLGKIRFEQDTKLPLQGLQEVLKGVARGFKEYPGGFIWAKNFIRYQWKVERLAANKVAIGIYRGLLSIENKELVSDVLAEYPELRDAMSRSTPSPSYPPSKGDRRSGEGRGGDRDRVSLTTPTEAEVFEYVKAWPGEPATGTPEFQDEYVKAWLKRMDGQVYGWPPNWQRALVSSWRADHRGWSASGLVNGKNAAGGASGGSGVSPSVQSIDRRQDMKRLSDELQKLSEDAERDKQSNLPFDRQRYDQMKVLEAKIKALTAEGGE